MTPVLCVFNAYEEPYDEGGLISVQRKVQDSKRYQDVHLLLLASS